MHALGKITVAILTLCCTVVYGQKKVEFQNISFNEALAKAKATGKLVFVDASGANQAAILKQVKDEVFTQDSVATFFNENCISIHVNMAGPEGKEFAKHLAMLMYPVYMFFDKDTTQIDFAGAGMVAKDPPVLMKKARSALAEAKERARNTKHIVFAGGSWKEILAQAKKENKLVFLDAYTTWCRPCIMMAKNVFTLNHVAEYYNTNFINVTMDMEKGDGPALVKKYKIRAYPDFLWIDGDGRIVHRNGGYQEADVFIATGKEANSKKKKS